MRYLLPLLLVVLCLAAFSGAALAADGWAVGTNVDIPTYGQWETSAAASVDVTNTGTTNWDDTFGLIPEADQWGTSFVPSGDVLGNQTPPAGETLDFNMTMPAISTLKYATPVSPTTAPTAGPFENNWVMADGVTPILTDVAEGTTAISRFKDLQNEDGSFYSFFGQIEEMAGAAPFITAGYADGTYRPNGTVNRGQMAAFMQRALKLQVDDTLTVKPFSDVEIDNTFAKSIKALSDAKIVSGFGDGTFGPSLAVNRGAMAAFLAKARTGGSIPVYTGTKSFNDAKLQDPTYGYFNAVYYGKNHDMLGGYPDGSYRPDNPVLRGAMSSFIFRTFLSVTAGAVVSLAGPGFTPDNPDTTPFVGWNAQPIVVSAATPGYAYVVFDAVRLRRDQAGPDDSFDVKFELVSSAGVTTASYTKSFTGDQIDAIHQAAMASTDGSPYMAPVSWALPTTLANDQYTLVVSVTDQNDSIFKLNRTPTLNLGAASAPVVAKWGMAAWGADQDITGWSRTISDGSLESSMAVKDGTIFQTQINEFPPDAWCGDWNADNWADAIVFNGVPLNAFGFEISMTFKIQTDLWAPEGYDPGTYCCTVDGGNGGPEGDGSPTDDGQAANCCNSWGDPLVAGGNFPYNNGGVRVASGDDCWNDMWWDTTGDPDQPSTNDLLGGGDMYPGTGYVGGLTTMTTYKWGTTNIPAHVNSNGDVIVLFCGGSWQYTQIDQAVLTYYAP